MLRIDLAPKALTIATFWLTIGLFGPHELVQAQPPSFDFSGIWSGRGYWCDGPQPPQFVVIKIEDGDVTATKLTGDSCIEAGEVTWRGKYTGNPFLGQMSGRRQGQMFWFDVSIRTVDPNTINVHGAVFTRFVVPNPSWGLQRKVPMSAETLERLTKIAESINTEDRKVSPMQVAAQLLEESLPRPLAEEDRLPIDTPKVDTTVDASVYESQRRERYIEASLGDAQILNPILSADIASSAIESKVFEGLIDRDEDLNFRGRLATHWEIFEEAYFYVNQDTSVPDVGRTDAEGVVRLLRKAINAQKGKDGPLSRSLANIERIEVLPPRSSEYSKEEKNAEGKKVSLRIRIAAPPRIRLVLKHVDQGLFRNLEELLGREYFSSFDGKRFIQVHPGSFSGKREVYAREFLPVTEHNPVIVFHLRPNVRFHDGHLFDAEDVKFTYEAIMNPRNLSPRVADYEPVKAVEVIDPLTVRIVYKGLYSPALSTWAMGILPAHLLNPQGLRDEARRRGFDSEKFTLRQSELNRNPIGCGPFKFETWKQGKFIRLRRFDNYWEGAPEFREYIFRIIPDRRTQAEQFYAGALDSYGTPPLHQAEALKKDKRFQGFSGLNFGYTYIGYNIRREPFKDRRVRRALGMAVDVDYIIRKVLQGQGERLTGPFVKQTEYYNHAIEPLPYDPDRALRLLAEAGWKRGSDRWLEKEGKRLQFTLITNQGNIFREAILAIVQDSWRKIGIDVRTEVLEWGVFVQERVNKLDFDALILGWTMGIEPDLYQIWHSSQTGPNQLNFAGFRNEEADDLIIKIRQEYDHDKQVAYCHRLHEIIAREQPYTFLYVGMWTALLNKRVVIKEVDPDGNVSYRRIKSTKTGDYKFHFNKWIKLPEPPESLYE